MRPLLENKCTNDYVYYSPISRLRRLWNRFNELFEMGNLLDSTISYIKSNNLKHIKYKIYFLHAKFFLIIFIIIFLVVVWFLLSMRIWSGGLFSSES